MTLDCFFDFACPYSLLSVHRLLTHPGFASHPVAWHPVDVEAVKRGAGNDGPPLGDLPQKARYVREDVARWARRDGISDLQPPVAFARALNAGVFLARQRGIERDYLRAVLRNCAPGSIDPNGDFLNLVCSRLSWPAGSLIDYSRSAEAECQLHDCLARARAAGVFGTPTFVLHGELWWGNDRLDEVAERMRIEESATAISALSSN